MNDVRSRIYKPYNAKSSRYLASAYLSALFTNCNWQTLDYQSLWIVSGASKSRENVVVFENHWPINGFLTWAPGLLDAFKSKQ